MSSFEHIALKAKLFRGLADPSRLAIMELLRSGEKTVSAIVDSTGLSQPNVSAHLSCLRSCGLVSSRQDGRRVFYVLSGDSMETLMNAAEDILIELSARITYCANYECRSSHQCVDDKRCVSAPVSQSSRHDAIPLSLAKV